jgi:microcystin-dependent protein
MGTGLLSQPGGAETQTLTAAQIPSITSANASQAISVVSTATGVPQNATLAAASGSGGGNVFVPGVVNTLTSTGANSISVTSNNTGGTAHNIVQPTIVCNYIIRII